MQGDAGLIVRRTVRHDLALPALFSVARPQREHVRYTPAVPQRSGWIDCDLIDFSNGGLGLVSGVFVPRNAELLVRVFRDEARSDRILEAPVIVQRIQMTDRRPAYLLGTAFHGLGRDAEREVNALLSLLGPDREDGPMPPEPLPLAGHDVG